MQWVAQTESFKIIKVHRLHYCNSINFLGVPLRVGLCAASPRSCLAPGFALLSLTLGICGVKLQLDTVYNSIRIKSNSFIFEKTLSAVTNGKLCRQRNQSTFPLTKIWYANPSIFRLSFPKCLNKFPVFADFFNFWLRILERSLWFDLSITTVIFYSIFQRYEKVIFGRMLYGS